MSGRTDPPPKPVAARHPPQEHNPRGERRQGAAAPKRPGVAGTGGCRPLRDPLGDFSEQIGAVFG